MFIAMLIAAATIIAAAAAYFSIYGLVHIYVGIALPIIIMGSSLEIGKLVAASFLYRYWANINLWLKSYLIIGVFTLMVVTSIGIFGYLTASYQKDILPTKEIVQTLERNKQQITLLTDRKLIIDKQISELPNNSVRGRKQLMQAFQPELNDINKKITLLNKEISELESKKINSDAHMGPIVFVAKVLNQDPDNSIFYFTLLIMSVFDPLAVALTLAANIAIRQRKLEKQENIIIKEDTLVEFSPEIPKNTEYDELTNNIKNREELRINSR